MPNANNKQFNTAATTPQQGKVNNSGRFFKSKAGKWLIGIIGGLAVATAIGVVVKKRRSAKKSADAPADEQPANQ